MQRRGELTIAQKRRIEKLYLQAPLKKPKGIKDALWIRQKTGISEIRVAKQIQELRRKKYGPNALFTDELKSIIEKTYEKGIPSDPKYEDYTRPGYVAEVTRIHPQRVRGWVAHLNKTKYAILIIDTTSRSIEKMSEIDYIDEMIKIYYVGHYGSSKALKPIRKQKKREVLNILSESKANYVHISAHGSAHDKKKKKIPSEISTTFSSLTAEDIYSNDNGTIKRLWPENGPKPSLVLCTACETGRKDIANAFWQSGCEYYIAPFQIVPWINSALFCSLFYYYLVVVGRSIEYSFKVAIEKLPDQDGKWRLFKRGQLKYSKHLLRKPSDV